MTPTEILEKPYLRLVIAESDRQYTAEIFEFPGCFAMGSSREEALAILDEVAVDWIAAALEQGQEIPEPRAAATFSGRLGLRLPQGLHRRAAMCASMEGVSLNQFIVSCVAEAVGACTKPAPAPSVLVAGTADSWSLQRIPLSVSTMAAGVVVGGGKAIPLQNMLPQKTQPAEFMVFAGGRAASVGRKADA